MSPGDPRPRFYLGLLLLAMGGTSEAMAEMRRSLEYDPLSPNTSSTLGWLLAWSGDADAAIEQLQLTLRLDPGLPTAHCWLGEAYRLQSRHEDAIAEYQKAVRIFGGPEMIVGLGHAFAEAGRHADAHAVLEELTVMSARRYVTSYGIALIHVGLGDHDRAFDWLARACDERSWWMMWLRVDPRIEPLRRDARYAALVARLALPSQSGQ